MVAENRQNLFIVALAGFVLARVVNPVTAHQGWRGDDLPSFTLPGDVWYQRVCILSENKPNSGSVCRVPVRETP